MNRKPTHPGEILREDVLPALRMSIPLLAEKIGVSRQLMYKILRGEAGISPEMALRLGKFLGNGPAIWLRMQQKYDLWLAEKKVIEELDDIIPVRKPYRKVA